VARLAGDLSLAEDCAQEACAAGPDGSAVAGDDQLALLFACCHPALEQASRVTLTLRVVCGLPTASIARLLLLPEPAVAQRIVRPGGRYATRASGCACPIRANGRLAWRRC
jgi:predicted RNA polymerase sigma factor